MSDVPAALYEGKAKIVYPGEDADTLVLFFKDDTSAFDGEKREQLARKGEINNAFNAYIQTYLQEHGVPTHFLRRLDARRSLVRRLDMIPVESVLRNRAAGSLCRRLGVEEGRLLEPPVLEFFLKNDALHDPMINRSHIRTFGYAHAEEVERMEYWTLRVNALLRERFAQVGLILVDFKLEFGRFAGEILLGDEFSPDGCRLWDVQSQEKMDKDRFRRGLGGVVEAYIEVARRLGIATDA
ncbi:phosphoribosylaminoimidazolesuccinocarboxamide synthase [Acidithiobacillus caldus]|jgi:phosphoribosylaminoimidazole-succinocarboxamide synthase|uniref:Phosphoribosylaminoimidazole-succinocarboxamide synthase n=2 Tax=Acidithiobacillus caldus TaxID=33059 RepID=F9ZR78_ACICS|nr:MULTISPECIES: phosphoribosylaminoimidazolesuccinocarboxamide synthase [Acidithiobacillus]AEK58847.1 Phosphoribosylaminoimidazole-succinocarboxamide synthase [Acidithiobacillus caldus SM-1]AUW33258.1 phosphoribosylaminoimidazolesuccinocarboxamide synthase [Acidithiobacillus caldus]MBU2789986.1 phosphoribosylaminoimidazolesuccinocarboxamide synthase [Acidithiobacillus caldus]MBU2801105.1 phosphoribosylaminoimidazolesuccinocarboxamide synthase [Acidithiobacillus caldus]MBU2822246.1 phosphoribo